MKLYHGSTEIIKNPIVSYGRENLDFGKGFYTTSIQKQAEKWVARFIALGKKILSKTIDTKNSMNIMKNGWILLLHAVLEKMII